MIEGTLSREAGFNNTLYFYATDAQGSVDELLPGAAGYEDAVRDNLISGVSLQGVNGQTIPVQFELPDSDYYGIAMAINGNRQNLVTVDDEFTGPGDRIQSNGMTFSFEDWNDFDFNDLVLNITDVSSVI